MKKQKIYALYKGEVNLCDGTIQEIADISGKTIKSLKWMTYPTYIRRFKSNANRLQLIEISEDE